MARATWAPLAAGLVAAAVAFPAAAARTRAGPAPAVSEPGRAAAGSAVFARMGCGGCHRLAAARATGQIGPDLDARLPGHTAATIRAQILDPGATASGDAFATMPADFGERMSDAEVDALVAYLLQTARR